MASTCLNQATLNDAQDIFQLVQETITRIYPGYYEERIVDAFILLHSLEAIEADIRAERVRKLEVDGQLVGTGTLDEDHIKRVFVLPDQQGKGHGSLLMDALERDASKSREKVVLETSIPAKDFYLQRDYRVVGSALWNIATPKGLPSVALEYEVMEKALSSR